jgi:hypothetical protein
MRYVFVLWCLAGVILPAWGSGQGAGRPEARAAQQRASALDGRVAALARALNLSGEQQSQLRALLIAQREQVQRVWSDESMPPARRVHATQVIGEATADRIRAMLNEEQRQRYNPPKPAHDPAPQADDPSIGDWMKAASRQPKSP